MFVHILNKYNTGATLIILSTDQDLILYLPQYLPTYVVIILHPIAVCCCVPYDSYYAEGRLIM